MTLSLLLDSALRSLLLGLLVWSLLKLARLRDSGTETAIWTVVLMAALSMPLLSRLAPGLVLTLPRLPVGVPAAAAAQLLDAHRAAPPQAARSMGPALEWLGRYWRTGVMTIYVLGFSFFAMRLVLGLLLTVRLYLRATPVQADWVQSHRVRATADIRSPVSIAGVILLPADHGEWSKAKRSAVLAHEEAHIARGDFFVQLAALMHCALFWFSPFAWWLQGKLAEIAEKASDEAAIRRLNDRATYAEILVDVSRRAQKSPLIVAMAKSSFIEQRIEHILSEAPTQNPGVARRVLGVAMLAVLTIAVAGVRAAVESPSVAPPDAAAPRAKNAPIAAVRKRVTVAAPAGRMRAKPVVHRQHAASDESTGGDDRSYDPRALLDPAYAPKSNYVRAETIVHDGREFYIRSSEKPVADVFVTYARDWQIR